MSTHPRQLGNYELRERLGQSERAEVWKSFDSALQRYVAVKLFFADLLNESPIIADVERKARVITSLYHPHIVRVHTVSIVRPPQSPGTFPYIVMDYIEGSNLDAYIRITSRIRKYPPPVGIVHLFTGI